MKKKGPRGEKKERRKQLRFDRAKSWVRFVVRDVLTRTASSVGGFAKISPKILFLTSKKAYDVPTGSVEFRWG